MTNEEVTLRLDGTNYSLCRTEKSAQGADAACGGSFNGILWKLTSKELVQFDPRINPPETENNPVLMDFVNRQTIRQLLNFGILLMTPGSAEWDPSRTSFVAKSAVPLPTGNERSPVHVQFAYQNGVPRTATAQVGSIGTFLIDYSYNPGFHGGRLPNVFTCYFNSRDDGHRSFTLRIKKLVLQSDHLDPLALDFHHSMQRQFTGSAFWSNGVRYNLVGIKNALGIKKTESQPMLTAEEATARRDAMIRAHHPAVIPAARTVVVCLLAMQPIILIYFLKKDKQRNKQQ